MRQIVLEEPGRFTRREAKRPTPEDHCALVRVGSVGLCGSDYHAFAGRHPAYTFPRVLGHELSGVVVDSGSGTLKEGQRCAVEPYVACGHCRTCAQGRTNCCENLQVLGIHIDGGLQEYLAVPHSLLHPSEKLSLDQLALVETLGIGAHAVSRSGLKSGESALVIGAGPIGLSVIQFAKATGASVQAVERSPERRRFAQQFISEIEEAPDGLLADVVFDATGNAAAMAASLHNVAPGGRLVFVGLCPDKISIDDRLLHKREITLLASRNSAGQFPRIIRMIESGEIDTAPWISMRLHLNDVPESFAALRSQPNLLKAIVQVNQ